ncbi:transcriptional antiterminator [Grimontia sp. S25]|uniref:Transcriptional antiterminator n=1 Tax=Grimontia sedimenti TaxID=2711294 RepID=A0A6M1R7F6_9GAMM|nr:Rho-binding antiterminator [Grimontia sedimenti]NGN98305.1 transcriptional antiterminator [Grimontia sedimenti]
MIKCAEYDYVEIACLYHYPVRLKMKDGGVNEGIAKDTARNIQKEECMVLDVDGEEVLVVLDNVTSMKALVDNPHFCEITFS